MPPSFEPASNRRDASKALPDAYSLKTGSIPKYFQALLALPVPEVFDAAFFADIGFRYAIDRAFIDILKEMRFLHADGRPTRRYFDFHDGIAASDALLDGIRDAYGGLLEMEPDARALPQRQIFETLKALYAGSKPDMMVIGIAKTFVALCQYAEEIDRNPPPLHAATEVRTEDAGKQDEAGAESPSSGAPREAMEADRPEPALSLDAVAEATPAEEPETARAESADEPALSFVPPEPGFFPEPAATDLVPDRPETVVPDDVSEEPILLTLDQPEADGPVEASVADSLDAPFELETPQERTKIGRSFDHDTAPRSLEQPEDAMSTEEARIESTVAGPEPGTPADGIEIVIDGDARPETSVVASPALPRLELDASWQPSQAATAAPADTAQEPLSGADPAPKAPTVPAASTQEDIPAGDQQASLLPPLVLEEEASPTTQPPEAAEEPATPAASVSPNLALEPETRENEATVAPGIDALTAEDLSPDAATQDVSPLSFTETAPGADPAGEDIPETSPHEAGPELTSPMRLSVHGVYASDAQPHTINFVLPETRDHAVYEAIFASFRRQFLKAEK